MSSHSHRPHPPYPDLAKSDRKDALVPDAQEYDMSDPDGADRVDVPLASAKGRFELFERLATNGSLQKSN